MERKERKKKYRHIHIRAVCTLHKVTLLCPPFGIEVSFFIGILFLKALRLLCQQYAVFWETVGLKFDPRETHVRQISSL